jgi:hypothetical protein
VFATVAAMADMADESVIGDLGKRGLRQYPGGDIFD